jgi:hypothetical protein
VQAIYNLNQYGGDSTNLKNNAIPERLETWELKIIKAQIKNLQVLQQTYSRPESDMRLAYVWHGRKPHGGKTKKQ